MRNSEKRVKLEKAFKLTHSTELQRMLVEYLLLREDYLIKTLLMSSGEEAISLRGELSAVVKLRTLLQAPKSHD